MSVPGRQTSIYRHYDRCGCLLYIGIAYDVAARGYGHRSTSWWSKWTERIDVLEQTFPSRSDALAEERRLIRAEAPVFNTVHAVDQHQAIVAYLVGHNRWEHLTDGGTSWWAEPAEHVVDWSDPLLRRLVSKTDVDENGCWRWQGHVAPNGQGTFRHPQTRWARRASYLIFRGPIPEGSRIWQTCPAADCVNPSHLTVSASRDPRPRDLWAVCHATHPDAESRWSRWNNGRVVCVECHRVRQRVRLEAGGDQVAHGASKA